jgi:hypothetical protein
MKVPSKRVVRFALAAAAGLGLIGAGLASCSQTPANVAIRSFQQAQRADLLCIQVNYPDGTELPTDMITPLPLDQCGPVPDTTDAGFALQNHLYAAVTQMARGELAIVDLTSGQVIDQDKSTPAINFIPVGKVPTDVKSMPDSSFTFVSSADPSKPAIYAIDGHTILGNWQGTQQTTQGGPPNPPLTLPDLKACLLPQPPQALVIVTPQASADGEAGAPDGGAASGPVLVAVLRGFGGLSPKIAAIDVPTLVNEQPGTLNPCRILGDTQFARPASTATWQPGPAWPDGVPYVDGGVNTEGEVPELGPSCVASVAEAGAPEAGAPLAITPGAEPTPLYVATREDFPIVYVADGQLPVIHVIDLRDPSSPTELAPLVASSVVNPTRPVTVGQLAVSPVTSEFTRYLYAIDQGQGSLMVYDVTDPLAGPRTPLERPHAELNPFVDPDRIGFNAPVATLTFAMHDWPLPNQAEGTSPVHQYTGLLCNPNANAHPDAGVFLQNGAYYRVDQASLIQTNGTADFFPARLRGVFGFATLSNGTIVTIDVDDWDAPCRRPDPMANGPVQDFAHQTYDPTVPAGAANASLFGQTGSLAVPQPIASGTNDFDPYHAPITYNSNIPESPAVTEEAFFPVSAPNRMRSGNLLENDPLSGNHMPNVQGAPQLFNLNGSAIPTGQSSPVLLATALQSGWYDPSFVSNPAEPNPLSRLAQSNLASSFREQVSDLVPGGPMTTLAAGDAGMVSAGDAGAMMAASISGASVRISLDDPTAHQDQDWTVTYEGQLPTVTGITGNLASTDDYSTLTLTAPNSQLCERGIEDVRIGRARAAQVIEALGASNITATMDVTPPQDLPGNKGLVPPNLSLADWTGDYVQITDDLLVNTDQYWQPPSQGGPTVSCWDGSLANNNDPNIAQERYSACDAVFGTSGDLNYNVNTSYARDFPILEAFDDHLMLGRFFWPPTDSMGNTIAESPANRIIVGADPSNASALRFAQCCFHSQAGFAVRTGGEWVASGSSLGLIHHVQTDPATGACVLSCDPRLALANARSFDIPWSEYPTAMGNAATCSPPPSNVVPPGRDSPLAMRNPIFSYVTWSGCGPPSSTVDHTTTTRDDQWKFSIRGSFSPLTISLTQGTNTPVSPQSMLFVPPLGQLAVVDGELQGLVLIDLNTLQFAHAPFF